MVLDEAQSNSILWTEHYRTRKRITNFLFPTLAAPSNIHPLCDDNCVWVPTTLQEPVQQCFGTPPLSGCPHAAAGEKHGTILWWAADVATTILEPNHRGHMQECSGRNHSIQLATVSILLFPISSVSDNCCHLDGLQCQVSVHVTDYPSIWYSWTDVSH